MAMSFCAGHAGPDVRNDCRVELTPGDPAIKIQSTVKPIYGRRLEEVVRETLQALGLDGVGARIEDSGAFDFCIRARTEAAAAGLVESRPKKTGDSRKTVQSEEVRLRRTRLYLPGNTPKFFINARLHGPDAIVLDLEDAVPPGEKVEARHLVRHALASVDFRACEKVVRINVGDEGRTDLDYVGHAGADTILLPKTESAEDIEALQCPLPVIALLETARGIAHAHEIAAARGVVALAVGVEDYLADIDGQRSEATLTFAYGQVVNAARSAGIQPLASVWTDVDDVQGFQDEVKRLVSLGFEGVGCIHPSQVPVAHRAMRPEASEVERARRIVEAYAASGGAISVDGKMVDAPVAMRAEKVLKWAGLSQGDWRIA